MTVLGLLTASAGVWLILAGRDIAVYADASGVHVGASLLSPLASDATASQRVYGGDAALVITTISPHELEGAAVMMVSGKRVAGVCRMQFSGADASEQCQFSAGSTSFAAQDTYRASDGYWQRRYADGRRVGIVVPQGGHLVPVPFPIDAQ